MTIPQGLQEAIADANGNPGDPQVWKNLGITIVAQGYPDNLRLFDERQALAGDAVFLLFLSLFSPELAENGALRQRIIQFAEHVHPEDPYGTVVRFFAACSQLYDGDDSGVDNFRAVADTVGRNTVLFNQCTHMAKSPDFASLLLSRDQTHQQWAVDACADYEPAVWSPIVSGTDSPIVFTACDGQYLERFLDGFLQAVDGIGPVHVHIVNPSGRQIEKLNETAGGSFGFSTENVPPELCHSPYYASARFLRLNNILDQYGSDVLMLDIDLVKLQSWPNIVEAGLKADILYFSMPTLMPWIRHAAGLILFRNTPSVKMFARRLANLLAPYLKDAMWFVDQMCLRAIIEGHKGLQDAPTIRGLEQSDGYVMSRFIEQAAGNKEKNTIRSGLKL